MDLFFQMGDMGRDSAYREIEFFSNESCLMISGCVSCELCLTKSVQLEAK
jgi:hypothetical protein